MEPDGTTRLVEYIADDDGFRAVVNKLGTAVHSIAPIAQQYGTYSGQYNNYYAQAVPQVPVSIVPQINSLPLPISRQSVISHSASIVPDYQQGLITPVAPEVQAPTVQIVPQLPVQADYGSSVVQGVPQTYSINQQILTSAVPQYGIEQQVSSQAGDYVVPQLELRQSLPVPQAPGLVQSNYGASVVQGVPQTYPINQQILTSTVPQYGIEHQVSPQPADYVLPQLEFKQRLPVPQAPGLVRQQVLSSPNAIGSGVNAVYSNSVPINDLSPISPSYITNIQYDGYSGAYSQETPNLVPAPITKRTANLKPAAPSGPKGKFLIYVPESESA